MIRIDIKNDGTGDPDTGNYRYTIWMPGAGGTIKLQGRIENHARILGWVQLAKRVLDAAARQR